MPAFAMIPDMSKFYMAIGTTVKPLATATI